MKIKEKIKNVNYRAYILLVGILGTGVLTVFRYRLSIKRLVDGLRDLIHSVGFWCTELFTKEGGYVTPTVNQFPDLKLEDILPWDWIEISRKLREMWAALFTKECIAGYLNSIADGLHGFSLVLMLLIPLCAGLFFLLRKLTLRSVSERDGDTKPLVWFKKHIYRPFLAVRAWLCGFLDYCKGKFLVKLFVFLWLVNLNVVTIGVEFAAFYFYFAASFKPWEIFLQLVKLLVDVVIMLSGAPVIFWLIAGAVIFDLWRRSVGYGKLGHNEMKNRGFINSMPVVVMACGTMGAKKTTIITDMALSTEVMFRDKALELLFKNDMKLPNFPWRRFEESICRGIDAGYIYNFATLEHWLGSRRRLYEMQGYCRCIWEYDLSLYRCSYDDDLKIASLWEIFETYGKLYFLYIMEGSLILSNYAIRTDSALVSEGHFPLWCSDFFRSKPNERDSRHSHILDFDLLRLGKTVLENSEKSGALEFGVVDITEVGKERQNSLELQGVKKTEETANQKNDLMNTWLKMARHPAVVDNHVFMKVFTDEQRPESWGADARDLCTIIDIQSSGDMKLAMPGFLFGELFYDIFYDRVRGFYYNVRYKRSDNTLFMFLFKNLFDIFVRHYVKVYNRFGYIKMKLGTRAGTLDAEVEEHDYYLSFKKTYSNRFSTDCYSEFFRDRAAASKWSLLTAPEYAAERATVNELKAQNSYFIRDLTQNIFKNEEKQD